MHISLKNGNFMDEKLIELELRAEISPKMVESLKSNLEKTGTLDSQTKRISMMYFGSIGKKKLDVRVRITNGECEVVVKSGSFGSHDRIEVSQKIAPDQFLGMVKMFAQFGFSMKVGERETINYVLPDDITVSLVSAGSISYVELEKMSSLPFVEKNHLQLKEFSNQLGLHLLNSEEEFDELCKRLDKDVDWSFHGTNEEYIRLEKLLDRYTHK